MKKLYLIICIAVFSIVSAYCQNEEVNNQTIISLVKEGFSSEEIIGAIETSSTRTITYNIDFLRELKAAGADSRLVTYIQKIAKVDYGYEGVMWWNTGEGGKPQKVYRSQFEQESSGFNLAPLAAAAVAGVAVGSAINGSAPSAGVGAATAAGAVLLATTEKDVDKLAIMGPTSKNVINTTTPVFRFFLPKQDPESFKKEADNWYKIIMNDIQSPNEFQVVKMKQKKNRRVFNEDVHFTMAGFSSKNARSRSIVDFNIEEINNNTFEVTFSQPLEPGEYVFFWKNGLNSAEFKQHAFGFDFSIQ